MRKCGLVLAAIASTALAVCADVTISPNRVEVLVEPKCSKVARFAAVDLTNHMSKVFGCEVPIVSALKFWGETLKRVEI